LRKTIDEQTGVATFRFRARDALYQLSVIADAREFDWEELYVELHAYNNHGERTGPWDFHPVEESRALVPSYWVYLNGERLGLWFFARVSLADLEAKRFRGRMAFWPAAGETELRLVPYRPMKLSWLDARLEEDPEDALLPCDCALLKAKARSTLPAECWSDAVFWREKRAQLETTHAHFQQPLRRAFEYSLGKEQAEHNDVLLLLAAHHLARRGGALEAARRAVDEYLDAPHWSNPREDGYQHDGDSAAALTFRALTWAYFSLPETNDAARRERILEKLALQGERFVRQALLNRDYWGGSLLQGHGWRSWLFFGSAVLHLTGVLPAARRWLRLVVPRLERALRALPPDGVLHAGVGASVHLYLDALADYRDALLECSGDDLYDRVPWRNILQYLATVVREDEYAMQVAGHPKVNFIGGQAFFNHLAAQYQSSDAAYLQQLSLNAPERRFSRHSEPYSYYIAALFGFLTYEPRATPRALSHQPPALAYFPDSGLVHYCDREKDITLSLQCGAWLGRHAEQHATGPCDRMNLLTGAGNFLLAHRGKTITSAVGGSYKMRSLQCNVLLIDESGPCGDIGYPMSLPDWRHRGEEVQSVRWDEESRRGFVRLNLASAYRREQDIALYTRDFLIAPEGVTVRDHVVLSTPRALSWLFQCAGVDGLRRQSETEYSFGPAVRLHAAPRNVALRSQVAPTPIVWSYSSADSAACYEHVRFDTTAQVAEVDFQFVW
jgi:hypothetical protein